MLGVDIVCNEAAFEPAMPEANEGVVSFIGLAGSWAGTGSVSCSPVLACRICAQMLMCEAKARGGAARNGPQAGHRSAGTQHMAGVAGGDRRAAGAPHCGAGIRPAQR